MRSAGHQPCRAAHEKPDRLRKFTRAVQRGLLGVRRFVVLHRLDDCA